MFLKHIIFHLTISSIFDQNLGLIKTPAAEDNAILKTEGVIRSAINNIFSIFKIKGTKDNSKLKQSSLVHNYFVSLTLQDYNNLKEIEKLSRVDNKNNDNGTESFIALLNDLLDEDQDSNSDKNTTEKEANQIEDVVDFITDYVKKLEYLKYFYKIHNPNFDVNEEILKVLSSDDILNTTKQNDSNNTDDGTVLYESEFWEPSGRRVYRGKSTKIRYYPFMASVQFFNKFQCAGSIIKNDLVITAASCLQLAWNNRFFRENPSFLSVRVGSTFYDGGGESVAVLEIYFHPGYNPKNLWHNIAVMRLVRVLKLKKSRVKKIDLDKNDHKLPMNTDGITILGWGAKMVGNIIHKPWENRLSYAILDIYPLEDCQEIYSRDYVTSKHFCAGFISRGGGACNRDVGGPGVVNGILTGVVSFGSPVCGTPDAPTVFTKLGYYHDWIETIMEQNVPKAKKRTTTAPPYYKYPHPIHHITAKATTFKIEPIIGNEKPIPLFPPETIERHGKLFKEFLKTIFSSDEVSDYMDHLDPKVKDKLDIKHDKKAKLDIKHEKEAELDIKHEKKAKVENFTTMATATAAYGTSMVNFDPERTKSDEIDKSEIETSAKDIIEEDYVDFDEDFVGENNETELEKDTRTEIDIQTVNNKETEKDIEDDIIKLIENTDISNIDITKTEKLDEDKEKKEDAIAKIDDSILTLLYLSDNERENNNLPIPIDKNDPANNLDLIDDEKVLLDIELADETNEEIGYEDEGINIDAELPKDFKDFTYRGSNGSKVDLLTKNVLYDILSEAVEEKTHNN